MNENHVLPQYATLLRRVFCQAPTGSAPGNEPLLRMCDALQELVCIVGGDGTIVYTNAAVQALSGYDANEVLGETPALWKIPEHESHTEAYWASIANRGETCRETVRCVRKDKTMYEAEVTIVPLPREDGEPLCFLYVEHDVSSAAKLERIHRRVAALTSHNLKTPLAAMRWQVEMLRDGDMGRVSKEQRTALDEVLESVTRTITMVEQWFTTTNLDLGLHAPQPETLVVESVVQDVLSALQLRIAQEGVSVAFTPNPSPQSILADRDSLYAIVYTLIFNAVKYNREGGSVNIDVVIQSPQSEYAGKVFAAERLVLSVRDTGVGIPAQEQERVFRERFQASNLDDARASGAGLGLYTARALTQELCGDIWFTSSSAGSHFCVALPIQPTDVTDLHT